MSYSGFIVHAYPDIRRDWLCCVGRLADGRSFAAVEEHWRPYIHIFESDRSRALPLLSALRCEEFPSELKAFSGAEPLRCLRFSRYSDRLKAASLLEEAAIQSPDAGIKPAELFFIERHIRGPVVVRGQASPGRRVDLVIRNPEFSAPEQVVPVSLQTASVDIETDVRSGVIRAVSIAWSGDLYKEITNDDADAMQGIVRVLSGTEAQICREDSASGSVFFHTDERSLLSAFIEDIRRVDPDVLTGWNFLDFDFPRLAERCDFLGIPFSLGRSTDPAKFLPGDAPGSGRQWRRRSASAIVPGRQVLDALRIVRAGTFGNTAGLRLSWADEAADFTLETVARSILGEGKIVHSSGEEKIAELDKLYIEDPHRFGEYCLRDAELVLRILARTGLFRLTVERASLTGVSLDKAWTSVVSFERIYGMELRRKGIAPPAVDSGADVSGAAGGTVLDPLPGLFHNVAVFDFRSLYPTIMLSFNIDPLAHARSGIPAAEGSASPIVAPNGAAFSRSPGLLPAIIAEYFAARRRAIAAGDSIAAQVYKILMNSFYGVLGTGVCRYGRSELAGAITSFARKWLLFSRDWFAAQGFRVLYGDTDSLFVETGFGDSADFGDFVERCGSLAMELNRIIAERIRADYDLESFIELRFEKAYRRFLIPPLRNLHADTSAELSADSPAAHRGRAKGYSGSPIHAPGKSGETPPNVEVKGMEAVRSDTTPLARRLQLELLELVFSGCTEEQFREKVHTTITEMRAGKLDAELVYRKRLYRYPETYTASTPPQVKAARALGWKKRRGTVEYLWTVDGPLPVSLPRRNIDYDHYAASQVFPLVRSIADAVHWNSDFFVLNRPRSGRGAQAAEGQMELGL